MVRLWAFSIVFFSLVFSGCASAPKPVENPLAAQSWRITYGENAFAINKEGMTNDLIQRAKPADEAEKSKLMEIAAKRFRFGSDGLITYGAPDSCESLREKLSNYIKNGSSVPVVYTTLSNAACNFSPGAADPCTVSYSPRKGNVQSDGAIKSSYLLTVSWGYKGDRVSETGGADLTYGVNHLGCLENGIAAADVTISKVTIKNPATIFQDLVTIKIDWDKVREKLANLQKGYVADGEDKYKNELKAVINDFAAQREQRYDVRTEKTFKPAERRYPIDFKVAVSRMQRALDKYKFEEANSRFLFSDSIEVAKTKWQTAKSAITVSASIFPEGGGSSAIVYEIRFQPTVDTFTSKMVFSEKEASAILEEQIRGIEKIIR